MADFNREKAIERIKEYAYGVDTSYCWINNKKVWLDYESDDTEFDKCTTEELVQFVKECCVY